MLKKKEKSTKVLVGQAGARKIPKLNADADVTEHYVRSSQDCHHAKLTSTKEKRSKKEGKKNQAAKTPQVPESASDEDLLLGCWPLGQPTFQLWVNSSTCKTN